LALAIFEETWDSGEQETFREYRKEEGTREGRRREKRIRTELRVSLCTREDGDNKSHIKDILAGHCQDSATKND